MLDRQTFLNKDLVLRVTPHCDPGKLDLNKYEAFLDALCTDREYQKEAIRETLRYLLGGEYRNLKALAEENHRNNPKLQEKYPTFEDFTRTLQLPDKLACSLDHATATGKSYVMYGIAKILLAEGAVDQVLVLCPSNTIEDGLTEKFRALSGDRDLKRLLEGAKIKNPRIINASSTIQKGDICIENIHATYQRTKSAISDSLTGKGERTLVLNDEAHHLMNPSDKALKKWKEFLLDPDFGFRYIVNLSGTCYIGDDYFPDVIHRFSLRDAIDAKFVKTIDYVAEDSSGSEDEKLQKVYDNHLEHKTRKYRKVKPLTILVTKDIAACRRLTERLTAFLARQEKLPKDKIAKKILIVTSHRDHEDNLPILKRVDSPDNPVEWITSVSMLNEGWDVKNVFQIVPHEERAFNSKLLIAQVLGRGLRIPEAYKGTQPRVTVFNHDKWSGSIRHLVNEVMEIEKKVHSYPVEKKKDYHFEILNIDYDYPEEEEEYPQEDPYELLKKDSITYSSQDEVTQEETVYESAVTEDRSARDYYITHKMVSVEEVAHDVYNRLVLFDQEAETDYSEKFPEKKIVEIIRNSLVRIKDKTGKVSEANRNQTLAAFGVIHRKGAKRLRRKSEPRGLIKKSTRETQKTGTGVGNLRRDCTLFLDDEALRLGGEEDHRLLKELLEMKEDGEQIDLLHIENSYYFKTPLNIVLATLKPERRFVQGLIKDSTASALDAWIKAPDMGFYGIDYYWKKGEHPKRGSFNPDFFLKKGKDILVVEVKMDGDVNEENRGKLKFAKEHFERLNGMQKEQRYQFNMITPKDFDAFFQRLREGKVEGYVSGLEAELEG